MYVTVDAEKCQGHGRCNSLCPEVFDSDVDGFAVVLTPEVPAEHEESAVRAGGSCPEGAIEVIE